MQLEMITEDVCSICKSRAVRETRQHKHCNGLWNEIREFECGRTVSFIPNFKKIEIYNECPHKPEVKELNDRRKKLITNIKKLVSKANVDDEFKIQINMYLPKI